MEIWRRVKQRAEDPTAYHNHVFTHDLPALTLRRRDVGIKLIDPTNVSKNKTLATKWASFEWGE